jgi:hypothetical protein
MTLAHTQFVVEHHPPVPEPPRREPRPRVRLAGSLAEAHLIAAELGSSDAALVAALDSLGARTEAQLAGPFGLVSFAPTA